MYIHINAYIVFVYNADMFTRVIYAYTYTTHTHIPLSSPSHYSLAIYHYIPIHMYTYILSAYILNIHYKLIQSS